MNLVEFLDNKKYDNLSGVFTFGYIKKHIDASSNIKAQVKELLCLLKSKQYTNSEFINEYDINGIDKLQIDILEETETLEIALQYWVDELDENTYNIVKFDDDELEEIVEDATWQEEYNWLMTYRKFLYNIYQFTTVSSNIAKEVIVTSIDAFNDISAAVISKWLPIISPLPNALNLYVVVKESSFNRVELFGIPIAALTIAVVFELYGFAASDNFFRSLDSQSKILKWVFGSLLLTFYIVLFATVILFDGTGIALLFPVFSLLATLTYGAIRSFERSSNSQRKLLDSKSSKSSNSVTGKMSANNSVSKERPLLREAETVIIAEILTNNNISSKSAFARKQNKWAESTARAKLSSALKLELVSKNDRGDYQWMK